MLVMHYSEIIDQDTLNYLDSIFLSNQYGKYMFVMRGHQGAGKSTFAQAVCDYIEDKYQGKKAVKLERDDYFYNENGEYVWSGEKIKDADNYLNKRIAEALKDNSISLICIANTNTKVSAVNKYMDMVNKHNKTHKNKIGFHAFRLQNGFQNQHKVKDQQVINLMINTEDYAGEYVVPVSRHKDRFTRAFTEINKLLDGKKVQDFRPKSKLASNDRLSSLPEAYMMLFEGKLFNKKQSNRYPDLFVLKYDKSVFYNNDFDDVLLEMRGTVLDKNNNIIIRPFKKVFNYSEMINDNSLYQTDLTDNTKVYGVVKVNGFLGNATYVKNDDYDEIIYSTTGSLDSSYADLTGKHLADEKFQSAFKKYPNHTFAFEILDESDPHIINEQDNYGYNPVFIGLIDVSTGKQFSEQELDKIAEKFGFIRPEKTPVMSFKELKELNQSVQHEGFMVFDENHELKCKMKSPFYLISKLLARNSEKLTNLNHKINLSKRDYDEEFYPLIDHIQNNKEQFIRLHEQEKIAFIQDFLKNEIFKVKPKVKHGIDVLPWMNEGDSY